jgi:hypothetical protein
MANVDSIKLISIKEAMRLKGNWDISLKCDGTQVTFKNGNLYTKRCMRNERFPHILKLLRDNNFPECVGEIHIPGGKVFDISKAENWSSGVYMIFDLLEELPFEEKQRKIDLLCDRIGSEFVTKPIRFNDLTEAWHWVLENEEEGLVLKNENKWYKIKALKEEKVRIKSWEEGKDKGAFILENGSKISGTSIGFVMEYMGLRGMGKEVFAEIEFSYLTDAGRYFQPRLRKIFAKEEGEA